MTTSKNPFSALPIGLDTEPMEAELAAELPSDDGWIYEPKWDGFRCLAFRCGSAIDLRSKAGKPLARYFPDVVEALREIDADRYVLDGEIVIPVGDSLSFDDLLLRIHPAESRVRKLAAETPAHLITFDLLVDAEGADLTGKPLAERREALERFIARPAAGQERVRISPHSAELAVAKRWLGANHQGLDGVMAKRADLAYQCGTRIGMVKVKRLRSADCVVGGFRWSKSGDFIGSLLLGLYGDDGLLHHVGFCSAFNRKSRVEATEKMRAVMGGGGFTGREPQGESRWRQGEAAEWERVHPTVVVEVQYDHFSGGRFRHGTKLLRWRPDKDPATCTLSQVEREGRAAMKML